MMDLTAWANEVQRLSKAVRADGYCAPVSLCYKQNSEKTKPEWLWCVDVGFLIVDEFIGRSSYEGVREFSAPTIAEATQATIVALRKRLNEKIKSRLRAIDGNPDPNRGKDPPF